MRPQLPWLALVVYLILTLAPIVWFDAAGAAAVWLSGAALVGWIMAPIVVVIFRRVLTHLPGALLLPVLTASLWFYYVDGYRWLTQHLDLDLITRLDLLASLFTLHILLALPAYLVVCLLRRDISLWLLGLVWFLQPATISFFIAHFPSIQSSLTPGSSVMTPQEGMVWALPSCLVGAACLMGGGAFIVFFVRLLIHEIESRPLKPAA